MATENTVIGQDKEFENSEAGINNASGNGSGPATRGSAATSPTRARRATGPRTKEGKERSKYNALKHGILSEDFLLKFEKPKQFRAFWQGLRRALNPVGMLQETLVEDMAVNRWQRRRFLQAENGYLAKNIEEAESDRFDELDCRTISRAYMRDSECELDTVVAIADKRGLIPSIADPEYLELCLDKLADVRNNVENSGFDDESIPKLLRRVYGARYEGRPGRDLFDFFCSCRDDWRAAENKRNMTDIEPKVHYLSLFLKEVDKEIVRLERRRKYPVSRQFSDSPDDYCLRIFGRELQQLMVPSDSELDRLLRYEASLERSFERMLNQFERVQRMQLGQPLLPKLEVQHTLA